MHSIAIIIKSSRFAATIFLLSAIVSVSQAQDPGTNLVVSTIAGEPSDPKALYELGRNFLRGSGVNRDDAKAAKYLRLSADEGYGDAQVVLGSLYGKGRGVPKDLKQAPNWDKIHEP